MNFLALDTSTHGSSVALMQGTHTASMSEDSTQQKSRHILTMIDSLLAEAGLSFSQLDAIAFAAGPGSFTGIRLAASVAQAIGYAQNLPVIPVSSMQAMAQTAFNRLASEGAGKEKSRVDKGAGRRVHQSNGNGYCIGVALNAYSGDIYWAAYHQKNDQPIVQPLKPEIRCLPQELPLKDMKYDMLMGDAWKQYPELLNQLPPDTHIDKTYYPYAEAVAMIASAKLSDHLFVLPDEALPMYLHKESMWIKSK